MTKNEMGGFLKQAPQVLTMIYGDLAQPGVKKVGIALETVLEFSTSFLLPIKLLNEKFKLNFEKRLNEYKEKLNEIPEEEICDVNPQVGTPIMDKLSYTTNDEIADLFTNLLTKASSVKTVNLAHPSFSQLIERLSVDEARMIKHFQNKDAIPTVTFRAYPKDQKGFFVLVKNGTGLENKIDMVFPENIKTYLDNLVSIGILDISHGLHKMEQKLYDPLKEFYELENSKKKYITSGAFSKIDCANSYYQITDFGKQFIIACNPNVKA
jgi:hypothetical protein